MADREVEAVAVGPRDRDPRHERPVVGLDPGAGEGRPAGVAPGLEDGAVGGVDRDERRRGIVAGGIDDLSMSWTVATTRNRVGLPGAVSITLTESETWFATQTSRPSSTSR